jgi:hypothetical protein
VIVMREQSKLVAAGIVRRFSGGHVILFVTLALTCLVCGGPTPFAGASSSAASQTGRISGVRRALRSTILSTTRYSRIHDFDVYFSLRTGHETYCVDYETVVLDEIEDLAASEGREIQISLNKKKNNKIVLYSLLGRKLKARIVAPHLCASPAVSYSVFR